MTRAGKCVAAAMLAAAIGLTTACAPTPERRATGEVIDDAGLTARVKAAMMRAENVPAASIDVRTFRGEVVLSGTVENAAVMRQAVNAARSVEGVTSVRNELRVAQRR
jgi:osmotically-inducible protein OsmY